LPMPCAISSRLTGVMRLRLSNLSIASTQSNVSKVASSPIIIPSFQISVLENNLEKSGKEILEKIFEGIFTSWVCLSEKSDAVFVKIIFVIIPTTTTSNGAGIILNFFEPGN